MIFVAGTMKMNPAIIEDFSRDVLAMRPKVQGEPGCHHYSLLIEDAATGLVNVMEHWDDDDALKVHFKTPWIIEFFGKYGPQMQASTVQVYDIAGAPRPLPPM
jgi:quinol monooxygenase YgiN